MEKHSFAGPLASRFAEASLYIRVWSSHKCRSKRGDSQQAMVEKSTLEKSADGYADFSAYTIAVSS